MRAIYTLCVFTTAIVQTLQNEVAECDGIHVRGKYHKKEILARGLNRPYQLAFYKRQHKIFFSFNIGDDEEDTFKIGYIEKGHNGHKVIDEVENGFAIAVDAEKHMAYFGGSEGIYRLNLNKTDGKIEKIYSKHNIWDMFFKEELYFINYPEQHLYKYDVRNGGKPDHQEHFHEELYQFVIDSEGDIFFTNITGLFRIKKGTKQRILYKGAKVFRAIELNNKGDAYFCGKHAIHVPNKHNNTLVEIAHVRNIFGLTFDGEDNIIYSDPHEIVKLLPDKCK